MWYSMKRYVGFSIPEIKLQTYIRSNIPGVIIIFRNEAIINNTDIWREPETVPGIDIIYIGIKTEK